MNAVPLSRFMPYGAPELLGAARPHMTRALMTSSMLCVLAFALAAVLATLGFHPDHRVVTIRDPGRVLLPPPPLLPPPGVPAQPPSVTPHPPATGIPIPLPETEVPPDVDYVSPSEIRDLTPPRTGEPDGATPMEPRGDVDPAPGEYVYYDEGPAPIRPVEPEYPRIAIDAGVTGTVYLRVLVGRDGRVRDVRLDPVRNVVMLNDAAVAAARQWVWKPALSNGHPVAVWVAVPFRFVLNH